MGAVIDILTGIFVNVICGCFGKRQKINCNYYEHLPESRSEFGSIPHFLYKNEQGKDDIIPFKIVKDIAGRELALAMDSKSIFLIRKIDSNVLSKEIWVYKDLKKLKKDFYLP